MDKLQKTATWIWLYKERLIFLVMVIVLCQRVWVVLNPAEEIIGNHPPLPPLKSTPGEPAPIVPRPPIPEIAQRHNELTSKNPFTMHNVTSSSTSTGEQTFDLTLSNLVDAGGRLRAQLKRSGKRRGAWYDVGDEIDEFDGYTLDEIDSENKTVVVYDQNTGKRHTLSQE